MCSVLVSLLCHLPSVLLRPLAVSTPAGESPPRPSPTDCPSPHCAAWGSSTCAPRPLCSSGSSTSIAWDLIRNASSQAHPRRPAAETMQTKSPGTRTSHRHSHTLLRCGKSLSGVCLVPEQSDTTCVCQKPPKPHPVRVAPSSAEGLPSGRALGGCLCM